jgi:hypothetical protein
LQYETEKDKMSTLLTELEALYNTEIQLMNEIDSFLTNIIKITEKWESVSHIHSLASVHNLSLFCDHTLRTKQVAL